MGSRGRTLRRNFSLDTQMDLDLQRLAIGCNTTTSTLVYEILRKVIYEAKYVVDLQDEFCVNESLRADLIKEGGRVKII